MARKHTSGLILVFLAPWVLAGAAFGQKEYKEPPPRPAPQPIPPAPTGSPSPPRDDSIPGLEDADVRLSPAPMRREGSFIMRQRGSLVKLPGGEKAFIFHKDASGQAERPMVLLPCLALQSMEQIAGERSEQTVFLITGQVYAYYNVNYLLPTASLVAGIAEPAPKPTTPDPKATAPAPSTLKDPSVQDLIRELETQHDRPRTLSSAPAAKPAEVTSPAAKPSTDLAPEGSTISRRRGRVVRLSQGEWGFAVDNSANGNAPLDGVLVINPCMMLQRMEDWAAQLGDNATLQLSGRIYQYQGRNYILPTMYQVTPPSDIAPRQ
jgi:hypothetical protein